MILIEVTDSKTKKQFHKVPHLIYKNDPNWTCPLEGMVEDIFTPAKIHHLKQERPAAGY